MKTRSQNNSYQRPTNVIMKNTNWLFPFLTLLVPPVALSLYSNDLPLINISFWLYTLSACRASILLLCNPPSSGPQSHLHLSGALPLQLLRYGAYIAMLILALGTAADNIRQLAGLVPALFVDGLEECDGNVTQANELPVAARPLGLVLLTWLCYSTHEIAGAFFSLPLLHTWLALPMVPLQRGQDTKPVPSPGEVAAYRRR